jgi:hypothetical protein
LVVRSSGLGNRKHQPLPSCAEARNGHASPCSGPENFTKLQYRASPHPDGGGRRGLEGVNAGIVRTSVWRRRAHFDAVREGSNQARDAGYLPVIPPAEFDFESND